MITDSEKSYRLSQARRIILSELRMRRQHLSAEELFRAVRRRRRKISRGTVYRNLDVLAGMGLVRALKSGSVVRYDGDLFDHDHLVCSRCERIEDVPSSVPRESIARLESNRGFRINFVRSEFHGLCGECRSKTEVL